MRIVGEKMNVAVVLVFIATAIAACGDEIDDAAGTLRVADAGTAGFSRAIANIVGKSGSDMSGTAIFSRRNGHVEVKLSVENVLPCGTEHGVHLHNVGDCSASDATSAGPHWNGAGMTTATSHGAPGSAISHLGDMGNIAVDGEGAGELTFTNSHWTLGDGSSNDVLGRAIIVHLNQDNLNIDPATMMHSSTIENGASGARIGCGVITASP